jgi:DNA-binding GntR family transcriptional regulator
VETATQTHVSKQEAAYTVLRERVLDGTYGPGHRLVIEAIARELGVSPMPVREAVRRLEAEGWIVYQRNLGPQIKPLDAAAWSETTTTLALLEGYATATAAAFVEAGDIVRLRDLNDEMRAALADVDVLAAGELNLEFHGLIHSRCPNSQLRRQMQVALERLATLRRSIFMYIPTRGKVSTDEHEEIVQMIERQADVNELEEFAREHKLQTVRAYEARRAGGGRS